MPSGQHRRPLMWAYPQEDEDMAPDGFEDVFGQGVIVHQIQAQAGQVTTVAPHQEPQQAADAMDVEMMEVDSGPGPEGRSLSFPQSPFLSTESGDVQKDPTLGWNATRLSSVAEGGEASSAQQSSGHLQSVPFQASRVSLQPGAMSLSLMEIYSSSIAHSVQGRNSTTESSPLMETSPESKATAGSPAASSGNKRPRDCDGDLPRGSWKRVRS